MSTGNSNLDLLIKLLGQTTSDNDNIALMAIRKANDQLKKFDLNWESFVKARITVAADPFAIPTPNAPTAPPPAATAPPKATPSPGWGQPYSYTPPPRTHRPKPQPKPTPTPAAPPTPDYTYVAGTKKNQFDSVCADCHRRLAAGTGVLWRKNNKNNKWECRCEPGMGCQATTGRARGNRKIDASIIDDLIS